MNLAIKAANDYADALNKLLDGCGYGDCKATVVTGDKVKNFEHAGSADALVYIEIGSLDLTGVEEVLFDVYRFDLTKPDYGFVKPNNSEVLMEPVNSYTIGFYRQ